MKSFTQAQITLVSELLRMKAEHLLPIATQAKTGSPLKSSTPKYRLIEIILNRVGDEDEYPTRFHSESPHTRRDRKVATIAAVVEAGAAYRTWFPSLEPDTRKDPP